MILCWIYTSFLRSISQREGFPTSATGIPDMRGCQMPSQSRCPSSHACQRVRASADFSLTPPLRSVRGVSFYFAFLWLPGKPNISYTVRQQKWSLISSEEKTQYSGQCLCCCFCRKERQLPWALLKDPLANVELSSESILVPVPFPFIHLKFRASVFLPQIIPYF